MKFFLVEQKKNTLEKGEEKRKQRKKGKKGKRSFTFTSFSLKKYKKNFVFVQVHFFVFYFLPQKIERACYSYSKKDEK